MSARFVIAAAAIVCGFLPAIAAQEAGLVQAGERIARESCIACHALDDGNVKSRSAGDASTGAAPSFGAIAAMASTTEVAIKVFLQTPHANMPNIMLTQNEIDALTAYILDFRNR
jgi:mono/diheme cytochrome c family protein